MLRIRGSALQLCDGMTRRDLLHAGGLALGGLGLADFFRLQEAQAARPVVAHAPRFGKAKSCILLYLYGSPSQLETFDPKPDAPVGVRGELKSIRSNLPGADVGELLPYTSRIMDRVTVLRSMTHPYPIHGAAYALTGVEAIDVPMELNPRDGRHHPFIGSVVEFVDQRSRRKNLRAIPNNIALPWPFSTQRTGEVYRAGPYAAYLGSAYHPVWTTFDGKATATMTKTLTKDTIDFPEPYMGITPESQFRVGKTEGAADLTLDRLDSRRSLLAQFDHSRRHLAASDAGQSLDRQRARALDLIATPAVRNALDIQREPRPLRESYGMTLFGQGCLAARRLVEAGSRFVSVFWDEFGLAGSAWDTHWDHYNRMKKELCPGFDRGLFGLISDLDARGLLDETLVVCISEHGRTPQISSVKGGGRDHWSRAYSAILAGGGIARGKVIGKTDRIGGDVVERPISPKDVLATTYHLLGIDPETTLEDRGGRPTTLVPAGATVVREALG